MFEYFGFFIFLRFVTLLIVIFRKIKNKNLQVTFKIRNSQKHCINSDVFFFYKKKNIKADIEDACLMHLAIPGSILLCLTVPGESLRKCKH
jgi:hypothetical protein